MKFYLKKAKYLKNYNELFDCNELQRIPQDMSEIWDETRLTKFIFEVKWLTENYTKQSIARFAKWAFKQYYNEMVYLLCLKDGCERRHKYND